MTDHTPRNQRERVSQRGFRKQQPKLVELAHPDEWRSIRYAQERVVYAIEELADTLAEVDAFRDAAKPQPSACDAPDNPHTP